MRRDFVLAFLMVAVVACGGASTSSDADRASDGSPTANGGTAAERSAPPDGGPPCVYRSVRGTATVIGLRSPDGLESACPNDGVAVDLTFEPAAGETPPPARTTPYRFTVGDGKAPPRSCLAPNGLAVGATVAAVVDVATSGSCSPTILRLTIPDETSCTARC